MAEYIDRESVIKEINSQREFYFSEREGETDFEKLFLLYGSDNALSTMEDIVSDIPAADVVPVVRCKECKYYNIFGYCLVHSQEPDQYGHWHMVAMLPDDFCSYGKRREK